MRKHLILLSVLCLILPLLFLGCEGDDGAQGPQGEQGEPGTPPGGPGPGLQVAEGCLVCHGAGKIIDVAVAHDTATGPVDIQIDNASFIPDNTAVVTFTLSSAVDVNGVDITDEVALALTEVDTNVPPRLAHMRFTIARLRPGQLFSTGFSDPDTWEFYGPRSHRTAAQLVGPAPPVSPGGGPYTFTFTFVDDIALAPAEAGLTHRVGIEIYALPSGLRSVNPIFDFVPNQAGPSYTFATTRDIVTTEACNECHNPLGYTPSFHGSRRVETKHCALCHNPNNALAPQSADPGAPNVPIPFVKAIHGVHTGQDLLVFEDGENHGDFTEVQIPQDIRNCNKCHKGPDGQNWNTRPSIEACGSCHTDVNFATGEGHAPPLNLVQADNSLCAFCHVPSGTEIAIIDVHRTVNATPNNPDVPSGLANFEYFIDNVSVDGAGVASVTFRIEKDGGPLDLSTCPPAGFTGGPSFILAWALPQDGVSAPADYTNTQSPNDPSTTNGNGAGDAPSVSVCSLITDNLVTGTAAGYTATLLSSSWERSYSFPDNAAMRAVAIQSYFTQTAALDEDGDGVLDNIGRHTPSVVMAVPGDAERRVVVKSGYDSVTGQPFGCLECHETLELHGGSRVNNPQVCVMCHNPNKSSSGRTADPSLPSSAIDELGGSPLDFPEATNNFKNMIHGIHRASDRPFHFVRNRQNGIYYNWSHVTFPGDLMDCTKCHIDDSYVPSSIPANVLPNVERTTTGDPAETMADIIAVRGTVPNDTDLVDSPIAGACYYCHDSSAAASHMVLNGGSIRAKRTDVLLTFPTP